MVESFIDPFVFGRCVEIPLSALVVLVDPRERHPTQVRDVARHRTIGLAGIDAGERTPNFEIADLAVFVVGIEHRLEVPIVVTSEAFRDGSEPLALCLRALDARLRALDESSTLLLGDCRRDVGDQLSRSVGSDLLDPPSVIATVVPASSHSSKKRW